MENKHVCLSSRLLTPPGQLELWFDRSIASLAHIGQSDFTAYFVMNWRTESDRNRLVRNKLRLMVDQWWRKMFAQGNCWCWQHRPEDYCDGRCEEKSSLSVQTACSELWWKTECQLGTVVLGASLQGTQCQSGSACGLAVLRSLSSSYSSWA